ncbi:type 2 isopentenyl-diphosphate Delta-isomerase [Salisediminibacterium beveridgei]|uniref:Isopentenyl-diphosphate delta-isomerase n=1 Tax=Salisediminibacterium beveridgei TaxID=632773 RepID=A0A1D7QUW1_9BACI|nr:type 2 isopentenyl-diphosphate Delta-isomerase [Salisediminibacterium beveridgei]AOM82791.1 Isopentenyl-diphosphate delta-isomerase, FMN-dependent [Salisediminibacterium beveridgei]
MSRAKRKMDHIEHALNSSSSQLSSMHDISFVHQALPDLDVDDVSLNTQIGELFISSPIFINAMTGGGGKATEKINRQLAQVANVFHIPMAVGSQMAAIKNEKEQQSYKVVRQYHPRGLVFANVGSEATVEQAEFCVDLLEADAIQIHLNVIQELVMPEGDRSFSGALKRIEQIASHVKVPVIAKEVGFGMSQESVKQLIDAGVQVIDVGGRGGTNFSWIENQRRNLPYDFFEDWGITTAASIAEAVSVSKHIPVLASGGIKNASDMTKSIALGAQSAGMAGQILKWLKDDGLDKTIQHLDRQLDEMRSMMTALGASSIEELQQVPLIIRGDTHHWLNERGIITKSFAQRAIKRD